MKTPYHFQFLGRISSFLKCVIVTFGVTLFIVMFISALNKTPPALIRLMLDPETVRAGEHTHCTVILSHAAPVGGAIVEFTSSKISVAQAPSSVHISAGTTSARFTLPTKATSQESETSGVTITASYGKVSMSALLNVVNQTPKVLASASTTSGLQTLAISPPPQSRGATYYVSSAGSDSNPGKEAKPFRTIQKAADIVKPGDTVIVENGVYDGVTPQKACFQGDKPIVCIHRGGAINNWVWFKARYRWGAKLDGSNNIAATGFAFSGNAGYVRIEGFEILGLGQDGSASGITTFKGGSDIHIIGNNIHDIGKLCTGTKNGEVGVFMKNPGGKILVEGNVIHNIGRFAPGERGCIPPNNHYQNHDHGIYNHGTSDVTVRNNIFYNINRGWAIQLYPSLIARMSIINNTFAAPNPYQDGHIVIDAPLIDSQIRNNIFYRPRNALFYFDNKTSSGNIVANNLSTVGAIFGGNAYDPMIAPGFATNNNKLNTDPLFVGLVDFRLRTGSPAIDGGMNLPDVINDFEGRARPQGNGHEIGAYEYTKESTQPAQSLKGPQARSGKNASKETKQGNRREPNAQSKRSEKKKPLLPTIENR